MRIDNPNDDFQHKSRNPMDDITVDPEIGEQRAKDIRSMKYLGVGVLLSIAAQVVIISLLPAAEPKKKVSADAPSKAAAEFQGKPVVLVAGGQKVVAREEGSGEDIELVETGTSTIPHFPKTIKIPSMSASGIAREEEYTLLGLGIRTVSFLSIQVYVVGMYVQTSSISALQAKMVKYVNTSASALIANEKTELKTALLDPDKSYDIWNKLLSEDIGLKTVFRIVPTRSTDFAHLKDGWVRGITSRVQNAQKAGDQQFSDDSFGLAMKDFKELMSGKGKAPKGSILLLTRDTDGTLGLMYQEKVGKLEDFGKLKDERIARLIWSLYLGGKNVSSEGARKAIVDGVMELVERPIGSVETMVV